MIFLFDVRLKSMVILYKFNMAAYFFISEAQKAKIPPFHAERGDGFG